MLVDDNIKNDVFMGSFQKNDPVLFEMEEFECFVVMNGNLN